MIGVYLLLDLFPVQCFSLNRTTHAQCGTHGCQDCRCKVPQKLNKPRFVLLCHNFNFSIFQSFIWARKSTAFSKTRLWLRIDLIHGTSWLRLASQVHGLEYSTANEPCLYFSIAFSI